MACRMQRFEWYPYKLPVILTIGEPHTRRSIVRSWIREFPDWQYIGGVYRPKSIDIAQTLGRQI